MIVILLVLELLFDPTEAMAKAAPQPASGEPRVDANPTSRDRSATKVSTMVAPSVTGSTAAPSIADAYEARDFARAMREIMALHICLSGPKSTNSTNPADS